MIDELNITLIVNSKSSSYSSRKLKVIESALDNFGNLTVEYTKKRGHAIKIAQAAADRKEDIVFVLAGDGTLNEAAQGLIHTDTVLAPIPGGSTNVFARAIGFSNDAIEALGELLVSLENKSFKKIGVGKLDDRIFLFNAGLGLDAEVIARVERNAKIKKLAAHPYTFYNAIATYNKDYDKKNQTMKVTLDSLNPEIRMLSSDPSVFAKANMVVISNLSPWTYFGSREVVLAPGASIDEALTVTAIRALSIVKLFRLALSAMGRHKTVMHHKDISHCEGISHCIIEANDHAIPYQVDGDYLGSTMRVEIDFIPDSLNIAVPFEV